MSGRVPRVAAVGSCPICEARNSELLFQSPDQLCGIPGEFTYRRCRSCRTVFQDPRVISEDIPLCYPDGYYTHASEGGGVGTHDGRGTAGRRFGRLREGLRQVIVGAVRGPRQQGWLNGPGAALASIRGLRERAFFGLLDELIPRRAGVVRALDLGCGAGGLMVTLARAGLAVEGLELDPVAAGIASRTSGAKVTVGDILTANLPAGTFDLVVLSHVFEHLHDPHAVLQRIREVLAPTGRAVLIYPNPEGLGARLFRELWTEWDAPRHLVMPPLGAIRAAAERHDLRSVGWRTMTRGMRGFAWYRRFRPCAAPGAVGTERHDTILKKLSSAIARVGVPVGEEIIVSLERVNREGVGQVQKH